MNRWKERRAQRGFGGFGSITRGVTSEPFMPSFGPSFDSHHATGGQGFYSTLEGMHERARHREWARRVLRRAKSIEEGGYRGSLEGSKGKEKATVDDVLTENGGLIEELQAWQEIRVRKGVSTVTEREHQVAEELLSSLTKLTGNISPADMLKASTSKVGLAHELARRFLPVSSASIRGTLDPRRPQALHDNITVKPRTMTAQIGGLSKPPSASPHVPPPMKSNVMPPPPMPQYHVPPPHTLPSGGRPNSSEHRTSSTPTRVAYPYTASPGAGNPVYNNRPSGTPSTASLTPTAPGTSSGLYPRSAVGPGPSNLRQSFAPGTPGANGIPYGMSGAGLGIGSGNVGMPSASR
ncbi:uncharacterized protein I303_103685 [Kwoniella dejecticola CBS 10117]|uniref:Uncharacterized protein n=1 Tax=Kwoniella dejecticola CBS 10117 TaxID=1296121 RepID=A0AAJ8KMJ6_9TREE